MARNVTLGTLVTRCQQRADKESDGHITTAEWKALISEMNGEMQLLVAETGLRYFETTATITATGASSYSLPSDHLASIGVDLVLDNAGRRRELTEIMVQERTAVLGRTGEAMWWALVAQTIELYPVPASGSYKHVYIPQPSDLSNGGNSDNVDVVTPDGEAFLIWGVAVKAFAKGGDDAQLAIVEREQARGRLQTWAQMRSANQPRRRVLARDPDLMSDAADWVPWR